MADLKPPLKVGVPGVATNPPPEHMKPDIRAQISVMFPLLPDGKSGGLFPIVTDTGVNLVAAHRFNDSFKIAGYVGKDWGSEVKYGLAAEITW